MNETKIWELEREKTVHFFRFAVLCSQPKIYLEIVMISSVYCTYYVYKPWALHGSFALCIQLFNVCDVNRTHNILLLKSKCENGRFLSNGDVCSISIMHATIFAECKIQGIISVRVDFRITMRGRERESEQKCLKCVVIQCQRCSIAIKCDVSDFHCEQKWHERKKCRKSSKHTHRWEYLPVNIVCRDGGWSKNNNTSATATSVK